MHDALDYLTYIKSLLVARPEIQHVIIVREEAIGKSGLYRYRASLKDGGLLEIFERFEVSDENIRTTKYSIHWQDADGNLLKRWDNAAHHPEISTYPHHVHEGAEEHVLAHVPCAIVDYLQIICGNTP